MRIRLSQLRRIIKEETKKVLLREGLDDAVGQEIEQVYSLLFPALDEEDSTRRDEIEQALSMNDEITKEVWEAAELVNAFIKNKSSTIMYNKAINSIEVREAAAAERRRSDI